MVQWIWKSKENANDPCISCMASSRLPQKCFSVGTVFYSISMSHHDWQVCGQSFQCYFKHTMTFQMFFCGLYHEETIWICDWVKNGFVKTMFQLMYVIWRFSHWWGSIFKCSCFHDLSYKEWLSGIAGSQKISIISRMVIFSNIQVWFKCEIGIFTLIVNINFWSKKKIKKNRSYNPFSMLHFDKKKCLSLALEIVKMTTSGAANDKNFIKMIFLFECIFCNSCPIPVLNMLKREHFPWVVYVLVDRLMCQLDIILLNC